MKTEVKTCAICGKRFTGFGNNPNGYLDPKTGRPIHFHPDDYCCDECNQKVIEGRIIQLYKVRRELNCND